MRKEIARLTLVEESVGAKREGGGGRKNRESCKCVRKIVYWVSENMFTNFREMTRMIRCMKE